MITFMVPMMKMFLN